MEVLAPAGARVPSDIHAPLSVKKKRKGCACACVINFIYISTLCGIYIPHEEFLKYILSADTQSL